MTNGQDTWRARYAETHTPGSEGGPGKRTGGNTGTAPGAYLTAGQHGLAQRYLFTALRAAREADYHPMAAHLLADLAFQAATWEHSRDAIALGQAAVRIATGSPAGVRALVQERLAYGHALAGQLDDFDRAYATGLDTLADRDPAEEQAWLDYLTPNHLDTRAGHTLTHAGTLAAAAAGDHQTGTVLLRRGERLLRTGVHALPMDHPAQRRALFEGAWLSVAAAGQGDLEQACTIGSLAVTRLNRVQSVKSAQVLRLLAKRLHRCARNEYVRDFLPTSTPPWPGNPIPPDGHPAPGPGDRPEHCCHPRRIRSLRRCLHGLTVGSPRTRSKIACTWGRRGRRGSES